MDEIFNSIKIKVNQNTFLKDPNSSELGLRIVANSIYSINDLGFEDFTFGKLAKSLNTAESSIYRYFENKHKLLLYLTSWYWGWMEVQILIKTANVVSPEEKIAISIALLSKEVKNGEVYGNMDLARLNRIMISESSKTYLTRGVDTSNREGVYSGYKRLVRRISDLALEINPEFKFSHMLFSTIIEGIHHQKYFSDHLPSLTDVVSENQLAQFYNDMAISVIKKDL